MHGDGRGAQVRLVPGGPPPSTETPVLRVRTLGEFAVWRDQVVVPTQPWQQRKAGALFKCLLSAPGARLHRERAIELLWPDAEAEAGAKQLRLTLHRLRGALAGPDSKEMYVRAEGDLLAICPAGLEAPPPDWLDAEAFERASDQALASDDPSMCRAALALYGGDYLPNDLYDEWAAGRREALRLRHLAVLLRLADLAAVRGEVAEAEQMLRAVLRLDACHEEAAARLMGMLAAAGRRPDALRVFDELATALGRELDIAPSRDLVLLRRQLLAAEAAPVAAGELDPPPNGSRRTNLPVPLTTYIERPGEEQRIRGRLSDARLLTLTGAGGSGKTRLALHLAGTLLEAYADGIWLVQLAALEPAAGEGGVARAVAAALGLREDTRQPLSEIVTAFLAPRQLLLVIDNCEHVLEAAAKLAGTLLATCPWLQILATSRQPLGVPGETIFHIGSMGLPPSDVRAEALPGYEAAALFLSRARDILPGRLAGPENAAAIAQILARLDGIPLAIELAAARARFLPLRDIAARLDDCFQLLTGGPRTALPRQRTLRATLDWSYALLDDAERVLFRRLAVFAGGWTLEAVETVCAETGRHAPTEPSPSLQGGDILNVLAGLADKSLVQVYQHDGDTRYRLLEPTRQYASELLAAAGEVGDLQNRHLAWCLALAEQAEPAMMQADQAAWMARLEREHDNLRVALGRAHERHATDEELRLGGALWRFWYIRGYVGEGIRRLDAALAGRGGTPASRAKALNGAGNLAHLQGDYARAEALHEECLALRRAMGDKRGIAGSLGNLGVLAHERSCYCRASALFEESLELQREMADTWGIFASLGNLGRVAYGQGDYGRAATLYAEALAIQRQIGDRHGIARMLNNVGLVAREQCDYGRATTLLTESLQLNRALADKPGTADTLHNLGNVAYRQGDYERAALLLDEALAIQQELGDRLGLALSLTSSGLVAHAQGNHGRALTRLRESLRLSRDNDFREALAEGLEGMAVLAAAIGLGREAATLAGAAAAVREALGKNLSPDARADHEAFVLTLGAALGDKDLASAWAEGHALATEKAVALALDVPAKRQAAPHP